MSKVTEYVAGFMFDHDGNVALIKKNRPAWQKDKCNAIGGHIEPGEIPIQAMVREFEEETSIKTTPDDWRGICVLRGTDCVVYFFVSQGSLYGVKSMTDEDVLVLPVKYLELYNVIPNLQWLIPLAKLHLEGKSQALEVREVLV